MQTSECYGRREEGSQTWHPVKSRDQRKLLKGQVVGVRVVCVRLICCITAKARNNNQAKKKGRGKVTGTCSAEATTISIQISHDTRLHNKAERDCEIQEKREVLHVSEGAAERFRTP